MNYILADDGRTVVPEPDREKWWKWYTDRSRLFWFTIQYDSLGQMTVVTAFIGEKGVFWRTIVSRQPEFDSLELDELIDEEWFKRRRERRCYVAKYRSYDDAIRGHWKALQMVLNGKFIDKKQNRQIQ